MPRIPPPSYVSTTYSLLIQLTLLLVFTQEILFQFIPLRPRVLSKRHRPCFATNYYPTLISIYLVLPSLAHTQVSTQSLPQRFLKRHSRRHTHLYLRTPQDPWFVSRITRLRQRLRNLCISQSRPLLHPHSPCSPHKLTEFRSRVSLVRL